MLWIHHKEDKNFNLQFHMDKLGVPQQLFIPNESWLHCFAASYLDLTNHSVIAGSDGSVKNDGSVGAAAVIMSGDITTPSIVHEQKGVDGAVSSTAPELVGLQLAVRSAPETGSLSLPPDSSLIWGSSGHSGWI